MFIKKQLLICTSRFSAKGNTIFLFSFRTTAHTVRKSTVKILPPNMWCLEIGIWTLNLKLKEISPTVSFQAISHPVEIAAK